MNFFIQKFCILNPRYFNFNCFFHSNSNLNRGYIVFICVLNNLLSTFLFVMNNFFSSKIYIKILNILYLLVLCFLQRTQNTTTTTNKID